MRLERVAWELDNSDGIQAEKKLATMEGGSDGERESESTAVAPAASVPAVEQSTPARKGSLKKFRAYLDGEQSAVKPAAKEPLQVAPEVEKAREEPEAVLKTESEPEAKPSQSEASPEETKAEADALDPERHPTIPEINPPKTDEKVVGAGV